MWTQFNWNHLLYLWNTSIFQTFIISACNLSSLVVMGCVKTVNLLSCHDFKLQFDLANAHMHGAARRWRLLFIERPGQPDNMYPNTSVTRLNRATWQMSLRLIEFVWMYSISEWIYEQKPSCISFQINLTLDMSFQHGTITSNNSLYCSTRSSHSQWLYSI